MRLLTAAQSNRATLALQFLPINYRSAKRVATRRNGNDQCNVGARSRNRTGMGLPPADFKSDASTNFATRAGSASPHVRAFPMIRAGNKKRPRERACSGETSSDEAGWRPGSESNRRTRLCRPLHDHSATRPVTCCAESGAPAGRFQAPYKMKPRERGFISNVEREKGLEPSTSTLARSRSTN